MRDRKGAYSHIIIGSGSAGSVLASRLSQDSANEILLLEAGPMDRSLYVLRMPAALAIPLESEQYNWFYHSEPEPYLDNRRVYYPRGRVVGGSSSINGMVYLRGNPLDYEAWSAKKGLDNWSYAHCLPYFRKMETSALGPSAYRGDKGPIQVTIPECSNPLFQAFLAAGKEAGYGFTDDVNGARQEGFFRMERSTFNGVRSSASKRYLHPALQENRNVTLETGALVRRILFDGRQAIGVEYERHGRLLSAYADVEVILSAGAINSPQILKRSGVGNAAELREHDVSLVADVPGVGENLQDHLDFLVQYHCTQPVSFYPATRFPGNMLVGLQWLLFKNGIGASNIWEAGSFFRSRDGIEYPNLQHHFAPVAISYDGAERIRGHGFQIHLSQMRPRSRGWVRLASADPHAAPRVLFNHLQDEEDRQEIRDGIRLTRELVSQRAFDKFRGAEIAPGAQLTSDRELDAFARAKAETSHHPSCTCRMGYDDMAVVDDAGLVHGLERLRIVDASIMPDVVTANINATTIMIAEKIADRISRVQPLPPEHVDFYRGSSNNSQR